MRKPSQTDASGSLSSGAALGRAPTFAEYLDHVFERLNWVDLVSIGGAGSGCGNDRRFGQVADEELVATVSTYLWVLGRTWDVSVDWRRLSELGPPFSLDRVSRRPTPVLHPGLGRRRRHPVPRRRARRNRTLARHRRTANSHRKKRPTRQRIPPIQRPMRPTPRRRKRRSRAFRTNRPSRRTTLPTRRRRQTLSRPKR